MSALNVVKTCIKQYQKLIKYIRWSFTFSKSSYVFTLKIFEIIWRMIHRKDNLWKLAVNEDQFVQRANTEFILHLVVHLCNALLRSAKVNVLRFYIRFYRHPLIINNNVDFTMTQITSVLTCCYGVRPCFHVGLQETSWEDLRLQNSNSINVHFGVDFGTFVDNTEDSFDWILC